MQCLVCGNEFIVKRKLTNLFSVKQYYCCDNCIKKYPYKINYSHIPLCNHELVIVSLFEKDHKVNYLGFILEYSQIYCRLLALFENCILIPMDKLYLSEEIIENYSQISTLLDQNIYILTNVLIV